MVVTFFFIVPDSGTGYSSFYNFGVILTGIILPITGDRLIENYRETCCTTTHEREDYFYYYRYFYFLSFTSSSV